MSLKETGEEGMYCTKLSHDKLSVVGSCEHGDKPSGSIKREASVDQLGNY
jgi:hypothetical protein